LYLKGHVHTIVCRDARLYVLRRMNSHSAHLKRCMQEVNISTRKDNRVKYIVL
jgi:hypothetical protein